MTQDDNTEVIWNFNLDALTCRGDRSLFHISVVFDARDETTVAAALACRQRRSDYKSHTFVGNSAAAPSCYITERIDRCAS